MWSELQSYLIWLEERPFALAISEGVWWFPALEIVHVLALALVLGSIALVDLRLLDIYARDRHVGDVSRELLPWTWVGFAFALISGGLLFASAATKYSDLLPFQLKMALLVLAGVNMLYFELRTARRKSEWGPDCDPPLAARIAGGVSLTLWLSIVTLGRWIGFV